MKYIKNTPLLGRDDEPITLADKDTVQQPLTPLSLFQTAGLTYPGKDNADYRPINALLDSLDKQEDAKILEIENEWWNHLKDHIDQSLARIWGAHCNAIWDELEERFESERVKRAEKDKSKNATGPGKKNRPMLEH